MRDMNDPISLADYEIDQFEKIAAIPYEPLSDDQMIALRDAFSGQGLGKYRPEYAVQASKLCHMGMTDAELGFFFGVCELTIRNWRAQHPAFRNACVAGKDEADDRVVRAYYQRAVGYDKVTKKVQVTNDGKVLQFEEITHYPPDVKAAFNWLKNRRPDEWRDRREIVDPNKGKDDDAPKMPRIELARKLMFLVQRSADEIEAGAGQQGVRVIEEKVTISDD